MTLFEKNPVTLLRNILLESWSGKIVSKENIDQIDAIANELVLDHKFEEFESRRSSAGSKQRRFLTAGDILEDTIRQIGPRITPAALETESAHVFAEKIKPKKNVLNDSATLSSRPKSSKRRQYEQESLNSICAISEDELEKRMLPSLFVSMRKKHKAQANLPSLPSPHIDQPFTHNIPTTSSRGLGEAAISILKAWMFAPEHIDHPYPTEDEKLTLAVKAGISKTQVSNWFVNARKRLWQPQMKKISTAQVSCAQVKQEVSVTHSKGLVTTPKEHDAQEAAAILLGFHS